MLNPNAMIVFKIRLTDEKHTRLRQMAEAEGVSMNRLIDEWATIALVQHDAELRFQTRAALGSAKRGLAILDKLEAGFKKPRRSR